MHTAYLTVTVLLSALLIFAAVADYARYDWLLSAMKKAGVPESWLPLLATLKAAGAIGLLIGLVVPVIGLAAAIGVTLYFVGAIITHLRAHWFSFAPLPYFLLAISALTLTLISI